MREIKLNNGKIIGVDCNDYVAVASIESACDKSFKFRQYILGAKAKAFIAKIRNEGKMQNLAQKPIHFWQYLPCNAEVRTLIY